MSFVDKKDLSESHKKSLRPKVQMGGSVFKNGKNVDKEIERQTAKKHAIKKTLEKHGEKGEERKFDVKKFNTFVGKDAPRMAAESNAYNKRHGIKDQTYKAR